MGFSHNLVGAALTVAFPLAVLGTVVLWGFFERKPNRHFGGISETASAEAAGRPEIKVTDPDAEVAAGRSDGPLG